MIFEISQSNKFIRKNLLFINDALFIYENNPETGLFLIPILE